MNARLEVCTGSLEDSITAWEAGASRIELNSGLETGGLTPSPGVVAAVIGRVSIPVVVMIRPRSGGFSYSPGEKTAMLSDAGLFMGLGASGLAFGALETGGGLDRIFIREFLDAAAGTEVVFHRAFDLVRRPMRAALELADLGVDRILTSGGKATAYQGRSVIRELVEICEPGIGIVPGAGVSPSNAAELAKHTGCSWLHGSFRDPAAGGDTLSPVVPPTLAGPSPEVIRKVLEALRNVS